MFEDSQALSPDSASIFPLNSKTKQGLLLPKGRDLFMDCPDTEIGGDSRHNSGLLLRFCSASTSLLDDFTHGVDKNQESSSSFNLGNTNGRPLPPTVSQGFSGFPPQYPWQSSGAGGQLASNLTRQNSSPSAMFSNLSPQNGYSGMKSPLSYSSGARSSLSQIAEVENESGLQFGSWGDSRAFVDKLSSLKRELNDDDNNDDMTMFAQVGDMGTQTRPPTLSRQLSTSAEIATAEKLSQFPETVPWNIRAKRGCATHPRSIAERVRRTRISERMRKLQELVPNMDKQTNTADMLDFAVEYIKDLQRQYKTLSDYRENCKCSAMKKPISDQRV